MIRQAARWLAAPWAESKERVLERLAAVHGATRHPFGWLSQQPLIDRTSLGKRIYDAVLAYAALAGVMRFRAFQRAVDLLEVFIGPDHRTSARELGELCRRRGGEALRPSMRIRISIVDSLSCEDSGKLRYFVPMHLQQAGDATVRHGSTTS